MWVSACNIHPRLIDLIEHINYTYIYARLIKKVTKRDEKQKISRQPNKEQKQIKSVYVYNK